MLHVPNWPFCLFLPQPMPYAMQSGYKQVGHERLLSLLLSYSLADLLFLWTQSFPKLHIVLFIIWILRSEAT
jgi:hypothetical protein